LDFHHANGTKERDVSYFANAKSYKKMLLEIRKCICVCSNCHRKIHAGKIETPEICINTNWVNDELVRLIGKPNKSRWKYSARRKDCKQGNKLSKEERKRICSSCNKDFIRKHKGQIFCSMACSKISQRKVERPDKKQLKKEIEKFGYKGTGRKYGVVDNTIKKWAKGYELI